MVFTRKMLWGPLVLLAASCVQPTQPPPDPWSQLAALSSVEASSSPQDVFMVLTNASGADVTLPPISTDVPESLRSPALPEGEFSRTDVVRPRRIPFPGDTAAPPHAPLSRATAGNPYPANEDYLGKPVALYSYDSPSRINATVRAYRQVTTDFGSKSLSIVVDDSVWQSTANSTAVPDPVTQTMVDAIADSFLKPGLFNDVYDYTTGIFGEEWGPNTPKPGVKIYNDWIPQDDHVTIFLLPLSKPGDLQYYVGYFLSGDVFIPSTNPKSNQRLMFYINSTILAEKVPLVDSNGNITGYKAWEVSQPQPLDIVQTLAHEFQHLIQTYHKGLLWDVYEETWLNEMMSMAVEDLLAEKLKAPGTVGLPDPTNGTALVFQNLTSLADLLTEGRVTRFMDYPMWSLFKWPADSETVLNNYAHHAVFGAYLLRNHGGPSLLRALMKSGKTGVVNLQESLASLGFTGTWGTLLGRWGQALTQSHLILEPGGTVPSVNRGGWFDFIVPNITQGGADRSYRLASMNIHTYDSRLFLVLSEYQTASKAGKVFPNNSNVVLRLGRHISQEFQIQAALPSGIEYRIHKLGMINPTDLSLN